MNNVRVWIVVLSLVCFVAGMAAGRIFAENTASAEPRGALQDYEELFASRFGLSPERAVSLKGILERYQREVERIKENHLSAYRSAIEPELRELGLEYRAYLRDKVLPPSKRSVYDELSRGRPLNVPTQH